MHPTETTLVVLFSHSLGLTDTGGYSLISHIGMCTPKGMVFGRKTCMHFTHGMVFGETARAYESSYE